MAIRPASLDISIVATAADRAFTRGLAAWLAGIAPRTARGTVTIAVVTDARMRQLNQQFRGVDAATDVLSFPTFSSPAGQREAGGGARSGATTFAPLGDIAIARGVAGRQARAAGHAVSTELRVLALHGLLHLLGYDHETDDGAMARVEARLRRRGGLKDGLIARAGRRR